jgi:hypothetical protein
MVNQLARTVASLEVGDDRLKVKNLEANTRSLILACARSEISAATEAYIAELIEAGVDWAMFYQQIQRHQIVPLVFLTLKRLAPATMPTMVRRAMAMQTHTIATYNQKLTQHLSEILQRLAEQGIPAIPYKGPALSSLVYGSINLRQFKDLDLWVEPAQMAGAKAVLRSQTYQEIGDLGYESEFHHPTLGIAIDLHRSLFPPHFAYAESFASLSARLIPIAALDQPLPSFGPEDLLLFLSLQVGKDCCCGRLRLGQFCDVAELLRRHPELDWGLLLERARRVGGMRGLAIVLYLAQQWLDAPVPVAVLQRLQAVSQNWEALVAKIQVKLWEESGQPRPMDESGFFEFMQDYDHRFYWQWRESWAAKGRYGLWWMGAILQTALAPTKGDRDLVKLPVWLSWLYFPIHWGRMIWKYGGGQGRPQLVKSDEASS